jgi:hypothetical protein
MLALFVVELLSQLRYEASAASGSPAGVRRAGAGPLVLTPHPAKAGVEAVRYTTFPVP